MNLQTTFINAACALALLAPFQVCQATQLAWSIPSTALAGSAGSATVSGNLTYNTEGGLASTGAIEQWDILVDFGSSSVAFSQSGSGIDETVGGFLFVLYDGADIPSSANLLKLAVNPVYSTNPLASSDTVIGPFDFTYESNPPGGQSAAYAGSGSLYCTGVEGPCAVPEPTTVALLGLGLAGFGWRGRKR